MHASRILKPGYISPCFTHRAAEGRSLALSYFAGLVCWAEMEPTEAEKLKGRRTQLLLYALMVLMIGVPVLIFLLRSR